MAGKGQAEGCAACAKWLLIIFNVLFCLLGIGLLAAGIYAYISLSKYFNFLGGEHGMVNIPAILLIVFGCITFLIATLGCVGACKESPCMLFTFAAIIGVLLVAEIIVGAVAFAYRGQIEEKLAEYGPELLSNYNGEDAEGVQATWDLVHKELRCCGFNGPDDWAEYNITIPESCTIVDETPAGVYQTGCEEKLFDFIESNVYVVGGIGVAFGIIELLGIVFACCVGCAARKGEYA